MQTTTQPTTAPQPANFEDTLSREDRIEFDEVARRYGLAFARQHVRPYQR